MYLALYRKYRPQTFEEVIGQKPIKQTLINQIVMDKIGHAYLFCGSRGTGKTSTAKIFAKAINCLDSKNGSPCLKCEVCQALNQNNIDVLEIDAASNNGVDEIRDLREKVKYPPVNGKYKVYIIDEVHMLSPSAFNALLKTLEEPPAHVVFILATTEVHKLPATILSRCMRFDFSLVSVQELCDLLKKIFKQENIKAEEQAIEIIARAGEGSVRDTLSIADRCVSYSGNNLTYQSVVEVLGTTEKESLVNISASILNGNMGQSLLELDKVLAEGKSPLVLSKDMISFFRDLLILITLKENSKTMVVASAEQFKKMQELAKDENYDKIVGLIANLSSVEQDLRYSINPRIILETAVIKSLNEVNLNKRVEALENAIKGNVSVQFQPEVKQVKPVENKIEKVEQNAVDFSSQKGNVETNQLLGQLLSYLRNNKEMSLLSACRQVSKVEINNKEACLYVESQTMLDMVNRDKYRAILNGFFESLGLTYKFVKQQEQHSLGDVNALASVFGNKLDIND